MNPFYRKLKFIVVGATAFFGVSVSSVTAQTSITAIGTTVTQNFNSLTPAGSWTNASTLPVWYALGSASISSFILNDGNNVTANSLSSFGSTGTPEDRALGIVPGGSNGAVSYYGWRLKNTMSSTTINAISMTWTLEQWRVTSSGSQSLVIYYQISQSAIGSIVSGNLTNSGLLQASPRTLGGGTAIDGNAVGNRVTATQTLNVNVPPGYEILICWGNTKAPSNHLMAVDNVSIVAKADQTISFDALPVKTFGDANFNINATATSGLTVAFSSDNSNVATVSGSNLTIHGPGQATITASQAGNSNYNAAPIQTQVFSVNPSKPIAKNATNISTTSFTTNWTANNGLNDAATSYIIEYTTDKNFDSYNFEESTLKTKQISGLSENSIYYYRIYSFTDPLYSDYTEAFAITTGTNYVTVNSGNWDTGTNWDVGNIKNIANSITVRHPITLNTYRESVTTNKLVIESGGKLTTNQKILVTNELIIEVAADGTAGQILNTNNIIIGSNAKITVRKTFASGWNFIGFPFAVTSSNVFKASDGSSLTWGDLNSGLDYIVQQYDGAGRASAATAVYDGAGLHWTNVSTKEFTAKKGYIVYNNYGGAIDFTCRGSEIGSFFSTSGATVPTILPASSMPEHSYWNLVATPLSSIFNLGATSPSATYYAYNGTNYLPALAGEFLDVQPFASFFLQASSTSISFANAGRKVSAATRNEQVIVDDIRLTLSNGNATYNDLMRIRLQEGANPAYEIGTDAAKMLGMNPNVSYIYTKVNNTGLAINTLPKTIFEVELTTKFASAGNYSISISDIENVQSYSAIILIDKTTGNRTDLLAVGSYNYNVTAAGTVNRFKVQLAPKITTGVSLSDDQSIRISTQQNEAIILGLTDATQIRVFDTTGKTVFSGLVNDGEPIKFENKGLYIFEIATPKKTIQIKSFVR